MSGVIGNRLHTLGLLIHLVQSRSRFRFRRTLKRIRSPRRIIASSLAILCFGLYLLNGIVIMANRRPADPEQLALWLSGGMVIYALYHLVRCSLASRAVDLELAPAEQLWLGGGPIRRSELTMYHLMNLIPASAAKTLLLLVVLFRDNERVELLGLGIFCSLVLLETIRLVAQRLVDAVMVRHKRIIKTTAVGVAGALVIELVARIAIKTPYGSPTWQYVKSTFSCLGDMAASGMMQTLAVPWYAPSHLAISNSYGWMTILYLIASVAMIPAATALLVLVDRMALARQAWREHADFKAGRYQLHSNESICEIASTPLNRWLDRLPQSVQSSCADWFAMMMRQAVTIRRYAGSILFSFAIPVVLCLSPLVTGLTTQTWMEVVGGVALCTSLLATPALKIDFRRDVKRMLLLRSLPIRPLSMVSGQITLPVMITILFQWVVLGIAFAVLQPGTTQLLLWAGMLSALAAFTFATENALFLAYPFHERHQGLAMLIRAKLTFVGKGAVMLLALSALLAWTVVCRNHAPTGWHREFTVLGAVAATWAIAACSIGATVWCWKRFDTLVDIPPE
ncbi:MAG: hypothetical protein AAGA03_11795 [Planctomycetota bacterium]